MLVVKNVGQSGYHYSKNRFGGQKWNVYRRQFNWFKINSVRENPADGGNNRSGTVHNPNSGDDSRLSQHI